MKIEDFFTLHYNWGDLIFWTIVLALFYAALVFLRKIISSVSFVGRLRNIIRKSLDLILIFFEPFSFLLLVSIFIMIKPAFHGLLVGILGLLGFEHLRNYFHGRLIMSYRSLKIGRLIRIQEQEGIITDLSRLGVEVRSDDGVHYLPYHSLITNGFVLASGDKIGGYYHLRIEPNEEAANINYITQLSDILISSPYVDGDHKPEISRSIESDHAIHAKILVKEEGHVHDLIAVLEENGYRSVITKS